MIHIQELIAYVKSLVSYVYYPYSFPTTAADECAIISLQEGLPQDEETGISRPGFQILVRGKARDFKNAEAKAFELFQALANKKEQTIGESSVVVIRPQGSSPVFIGLDEADRPIYSLNFNMVIR